MPVDAPPALAPRAFTPLPPGAVRARGWLAGQLRLSAAGLTGHLAELWPDVGPDSGWLGGPGESWERGPYFARGLVALAHTLGDSRLLAQARPWIEWTLASQRADGFFGPAASDDWWPRMPMLDALRLHHEATGDARVPAFMARYFRHQLTRLPARPLDAWGKARGGDNLEHVLWLHDRTGDASLLALADLLHRQTTDWLAEFGRDGPGDQFEVAHGVNRAMGLKEPAAWFRRSRAPAHLAAVRAGWEATLRHHGQVQGTYSCDELLHGRAPTQGTELCTIVELLSTFASVLAVGGGLWAADALERVAYNALPAILSPDHRGHQYFQLANQVACTPGPHAFWYHHETDLLFGPTSGYGCCAANMHLAWPKVVSHLWLATPAGGLAALVFGPCEVAARVAGGQSVRVIEDTVYPFAGEVRFTVRTGVPVDFPLAVRIPAWAGQAEVTLEGRPLAPGRGGTLVTVRRTWRDGDTLSVRLPLAVTVSHPDDDALAIERGPLVFALPVGEHWRKVGGTEPFADYELHPTTPWNYGLLLDPAAPARGVRVESREASAEPWTAARAPVRLHVSGRRLPDWRLAGGTCGPVPASGGVPDTPPEPLALVPFGCARLRVAVLPWVR